MKRETTRKAGASALAAVAMSATIAGAVVASACRKSAPDEIVWGGGTSGGTSPTGTGTSPPAPQSLKSQVLVATADCAIDRYREFEDRARTLRDTSRAYANDRSPANATAARAAWISAMASWEEAEVFNFGPAASSSTSGGKGFRDAIYAWPLTDRCRIEEQVFAKAYEKPEFATSLISARTLSATEYLLFYEAADNHCPSYSPINTGDAWKNLGDAERTARKAAYAAAVGDQVVGEATALKQAWEPGGGNFKNELVTAGTGSRTFASDQAALNAISDGMFYVEKDVKDVKLGKPLGLNQCLAASCADQVESLWAKTSAAHIRANLIGFRRLFEGCGPDGSGQAFDDLLRAVGAGDLADRMIKALAEVRAAVDGLDVPLEEAFLTAPEKARAIYDKLKVLTDALKTEMVTMLNLELPKGAEGDND